MRWYTVANVGLCKKLKRKLIKLSFCTCSTNNRTNNSLENISHKGQSMANVQDHKWTGWTTSLLGLDWDNRIGLLWGQQTAEQNGGGSCAVSRGGSTLGQGARALPSSRFTCCPQIQKLAEKKIPKQFKMLLVNSLACIGLNGVRIFFGFGERITWTRWWRGWWGNAPQNFWARTSG